MSTGGTVHVVGPAASGRRVDVVVAELLGVSHPEGSGAA